MAGIRTRVRTEGRRVFGDTLRLVVGLALVLVFPGTGVADESMAVAAPLAPKRLLLGGSQVDGRMVVVGQYGHVLVSDDGGQEWQQASVPSRVTLTDVFMLNEEQGWAVGHDATVLVTRDGGRTWQLQYEDPEFDAPLLSVWFRDENYGLAVGAYGLMLMTEDGGENWVEHAVNDEDDFHLNDLVSAGSGVLYMAAEAGILYRSADDGLSWEELESPYEGSFFGILPLRGDSLLAFGLRGHLFRSDDAGGTWKALDSGTEGIIMSGRRLASDRIVLVGLTGSILVSDDDGESFRLYGQPDREALLEVLESDQDSLITVGEFGVRRKRLQDIQPGAAS